MTKTFTNQEVASLLRKVAAAYEIKDKNRFRIIAYDRAADAIEHLTSDVKDLWDDDQLKTIPGVGANLTQHLDELFRRGKVAHFDKAMKSLPPAMFPLIDVPGFGPKTAHRLVKTLGIKSGRSVVKNLIRAAERGKIRKIEGFGEQSEAKILASLLGFQKRQTKPPRMLLVYALETAQPIIDYLRESPDVLRVDPLGSLRRRLPTVKDIDLAVAAKRNQAAIDHFIRFPRVKKVVEAGSMTASVLLENGLQIDLMVQPPESYGALLQHFTGSKHHNIQLREVALSQGLSLSEYGIKSRKTGQIQKFADEDGFYKSLGMDWIPPELREDGGEIEAATNHRLPKLVEKTEIKGDLHVHSSFDIEPSHDLGENTIAEVAGQAVALGYDYLGLAEHSPSKNKHSEEDIIQLIKGRNREIDKFLSSRGKSVKKGGIKILKSLEVDILPDGNLSVPDGGLALLDGAIVAVHTAFKMTKAEMTQRVLKALANPFVRVLAHPTGRIINKREGYELNWEKVFSFCLKHNKALEINAWPTRLDLPDVLVREAVKKSVKLMIGSDAHSQEEMGVISFGVAVARRGWAEKNDILNTLSYNQLINWFRQRN